MHVSGVLAAVAAGMYGGWMGPEILSASARLSATAVWQMLVFLLNCLLFIFIGLQLPAVMNALVNYSEGKLILYGLAASATVILVRPIWVFPSAWLPRWLSNRIRECDPLHSWRPVAIVSWSGMRGVVSLAAALALPIEVGEANRDLIIFLTFCVIFATLVVQGLSLPWIVRALGVEGKVDEEAERAARLKLAEAAVARLNEVAFETRADMGAVKRVLEIYERRVQRWNDPLGDTLGWSDSRQAYVMTRVLLLEAVKAERRELIRLRRENHVDEELMHRIEREIDLEESRLQT